ncbi:MAG: sigma-70 family RNA polymerase sigma factor [Xanthomonadales bacterium]|nr:sigma-70 family RNA polymerase sigma factor [Xanthomonadales bacterium]
MSAIDESPDFSAHHYANAVSGERAIVLRVQAGDQQAFGELVMKYMQRAYYGALGLTGSHDDALELSQEAFARAFRARATIDPELPFYTWYYQILQRLCFNLGRDGKTRREKLAEQNSWLVAEAESRQPHNPETQLQQEQLAACSRAAIESLGNTEREIIVLRELQDMSYQDIATLLDIPIGTVMSRLYTARKRLATQLADLL